MSLVPFVVKALNGGLIVSIFAVFGQVAQPKRFAGIFSAAPTVALANLIVLVVVSGSNDLRTYAAGMVLGTVGFLLYALGCQTILERLGSVRGSVASLLVWIVVVVPLLAVVSR